MFRNENALKAFLVRGPSVWCLLYSSPVKKPSLLKAHQFEGDSFDSASDGSEGLGPCVLSLSTLIGTVAETSKEKYRLLDQRDRIMRQGMACGGRGSKGLVRSSSWVPSGQEQLLSIGLYCC